MTDYQAIDCRRHSELELHIMHKDQLILDWVDSEQQRHQTIAYATDIQSIKGDGEYLVIKDNNDYTSRIRLDRILSFKIDINY